jgi:hypothetical protein
MSTWRPARSLTVLKSQVDRAHPGRSTASDGMKGDPLHQATTSDHNPAPIRGEQIVTAFDITNDPWLPALVNSLVASRDRRIKYMIFQRRIISPPTWQWRGYDGANPHTLHVHLSVNADTCDITSPWNIGAEDLTIVDAATKTYLEAKFDDINSRIGTIDANAAKRLRDMENKLAAAIAATKGTGA